MVAHSLIWPARESTLLSFDAITSGDPKKSASSDVSRREMSNTVDEKEDEYDISSYYGNEGDGEVTIDDIVEHHIKLRENKLHALLLRPETTDFFEAITLEDDQLRKSAISAMIFQSNEHFHTFAELVTEDLVKLVDNNVIVTPLCERMLTTLAEVWEDDQS
jgi:hypothetical protein